MFEVNSAVKGSLPTKPTQTGFYALIRDYILTESGDQHLSGNLFIQLILIELCFVCPLQLPRH